MSETTFTVSLFTAIVLTGGFGRPSLVPMPWWSVLSNAPFSPFPTSPLVLALSPSAPNWYGG